MLWEREQNSAGLEYTTRLHESRKPSILKCLFHNSHKNSFFRCLGYFSKKEKTTHETSLRGACSGKKSYSTRSAKQQKKYSHRDLNTDDGRRSEKGACSIARARKTSSVSMCCCCGAMHIRRRTRVRRAGAKHRKTLCFLRMISRAFMKHRQVFQRAGPSSSCCFDRSAFSERISSSSGNNNDYERHHDKARNL